MMSLVLLLDQHAGAVQAVLTAVVAVLTWRYVSLTSAISDSAQKQVEIAKLNAEASAALQKSTAQQVAFEEMRQRDESDRRKAAEERATRLLAGMCARYLAHFAPAPSSGPLEGFFRNAPPIEDADVSMLRETAVDVPRAEPEQIERLLHVLNVLRDLQAKTRGAKPAAGYPYTDVEKRMYVESLSALRAELERHTTFRPAAQI